MVDDLHGTEQRGLFIQHLAGIGTKRRWYVESTVFYKSIRSWIPRGIAPGFKGCPQAAGGKRRSVRLTLDKLLSGKLHQRFSVPAGSDKGVMFFRSNAGHWLEPVGIMGRPFFNGPVLHNSSHNLGDIGFQAQSFIHGLFQRLINMFRQPFAHNRVVKDLGTEILNDIEFLAHKRNLLSACSRTTHQYSQATSS